MSSPVTVTIEAAVATVTVSNPPVNSLSEHVLAELADQAAALASDPEVRAVVLTGAGDRTFLAGADIGELGGAVGDPARMAGHVEISARAFEAWSGLEQPLIAAVGGHAVGGGLEIALLCDLIVVDPRAKLGLTEVALGLIPGAGGTQRLPRRVGAATAARLLLTAELLSAPEALAVGLVDFEAAEGEALGQAQELAARLAAMPGRAVRAAKAALRVAAESPLPAGLAAERDLFLGVAGSADAVEGVAAFLAKRRPSFVHA